MLKIYNSLTRTKQEFIPLESGHVKMYACGITVSGPAHIGHGVQAMIFDIIRKYLEKKGYVVKYCRNYTDVDDKIIANAQKQNINPMTLARKNIEETDYNMHRLNVRDATKTLKATEHINEIIEFVQKLIDKGYAYVTDRGDVYYSVEKFKGYGKLSNRNLEDAYSGVRIDTEDNKKNPLDFALWKSAKEGEIFWNSPWGKGRPGWHIECSCMNYYNLGEQIDIHGGGRDLIFPHHENEIAQTEAVTGTQFAKYWIHNGLIKVNGQKMSKSLNNSIYLDDILNKYDNEVIRFALLQTNYRNDINITDDFFTESKRHLINFYKVLRDVENMHIASDKKNKSIDDDFNEAMDDDFNTAKTLANLFNYFKQMKVKINNNDLSVIEDYNQIKETYSLLGLFLKDSNEFLSKQEDQIIDENIQMLAQKRWEAKKNKNYKEADEIRKQLNDLGYDILDSKDDYKIVIKK